MGKLIIYQPDDKSTVSVKLEGNSVWLTQRQLSEILDTSTDNVGLHLKNIYISGELLETATTEDFSVVQQEGQRSVSRKIKHYNLDAIISVAYRVNSKRGTLFRQWATTVLRDHLMQGWTLDRARFEHNAAELEAAHLLYFIIKNHPLSDGNKRTGALLFVDFLNRNNALMQNGQPIINDIRLAALALLIAESEPKQKETMIRLIENMLVCLE